MRPPICSVLLACVLMSSGCGQKKSTDELITDLKSPHEKDRIIAVRLLPHHRGEAARILPALTEALKDKESDIRRGAAIGLGRLGAEAAGSIPALLAIQRDRDARVREAVRIALSRIDPRRFPPRR